jgi:pyroglutamyl-peptidase
MMTTILVTGFGPFPGAPFNPTAPLVERLARLRRPALAGVTIVPHVFPTSYAAVDRELPKLLVKHRPDALLMFGLATRAKKVRVELRARNTLSSLADAAAHSLSRRAIAIGARATQPLPAPARLLLGAIRAARVPVELSQDAGGYLCNYLCWNAAEAARRPRGPRLAAFVHVPQIQQHPGRRAAKTPLTLGDLVRVGERLLTVLAAAAGR